MQNQIPVVRLSRAEERYGGRKKLAEFLGITPEALANMERRGREFLPPVRAFQVVSKYPDLDEMPHKEN